MMRALPDQYTALPRNAEKSAPGRCKLRGILRAARGFPVPVGTVWGMG